MYEEVFRISIVTTMFSFLGEPGEIFAFYRRLIMRLPDYLNKPLGSCNLCLTGQVCFWYYIICHHAEYNIINHLFYASFGIFLSYIYSIIWNYE